MCHFLFTTTKIKSLSFSDFANPKTKSIDISTQCSLGTGKSVYSLCGKLLILLPYIEGTYQKFSQPHASFLANKNVHAEHLMFF